jgi:hypothetical protein
MILVQSTYHERPMDYTLKTYRAESRFALFITVKIKNLFWDKIYVHFCVTFDLIQITFRSHSIIFGQIRPPKKSGSIT